ncbi:unnamed protein product [Dibothriocephalus latus]|uniref:Uncharacterized protein n=1 Tax=Dibothriocephalus latus TaxID=60516 RepID=A0A3P7NT89_DIBLA|nr:unnamed protein product [Dibothriocephalus latus]
MEYDSTRLSGTLLLGYRNDADGMLLSGLVLRFYTPFYGEWPIFHVSRFLDKPKDSLPLPAFYIASATNVANDISTRVRKIALATILTRAGLSLDTVVIRHAAREVVLMAVIPCLIEAMLVTIISKFVFHWPWAWAAMIGKTITRNLRYDNEVPLLQPNPTMCFATH